MTRPAYAAVSHQDALDESTGLAELYVERRIGNYDDDFDSWRASVKLSELSPTTLTCLRSDWERSTDFATALDDLANGDRT